MFSFETTTLLTLLKEEGIRRKTPNISDATGKYLYDLVTERNYSRLLEL